jgi:hypothetical protein
MTLVHPPAVAGAGKDRFCSRPVFWAGAGCACNSGKEAAHNYEKPELIAFSANPPPTLTRAVGCNIHVPVAAVQQQGAKAAWRTANAAAI